MRITLDYCRNCIGFFNKINSYIQWIFFEHFTSSWLIVALILASCGFIHYEVNIKNELTYPFEAYNELQTIAVSHAIDHCAIANFSTLSEEIDYNCSVSREKITSTYSISSNIRFFQELIVTVEQTGPNFEQVNVYRNFEENNYISKLRNSTLIFFATEIWLMCLGAVFFLYFATGFLNRIILKVRKDK